MINSIKNKRKDLDYNSREDLTFIFIDDDCNEEKRKIIKALKEKLSKDTVIEKVLLFLSYGSWIIFLQNNKRIFF